MKKAYISCASLVVIAAASLANSPVWAQDTQGAVKEAEYGEIIVTATRSETLLSKTPVAISAVTGEGLRDAGITNPTALADTVPNLSIVRGNGLQITIRGVTSTDSTEKGDPSAAFLLDGVYLARPQAQEVSFFDIDRVEVLRGPQGTLYGRNTTAGVVHVISARPKQEFQASGDFAYSSFDNIQATGMINVPVGERIALRAAVNFDRRDNFIIPPATAPSIDPFKKNVSARVSALADLSDDASLLVIADYSTMKGHPNNTVPIGNFFSGSFAADTSPTYLKRSARAYRTTARSDLWPSFRDNEGMGVMAEFNWDFGLANLTYVGSYREFERSEHSTIINAQNRATFDGDYWQNSQELRLAFGGDGPFKAQVGGYYFKEKSSIEFFILDPQNLGFPPFATQFGFPQDPTIAIGKAAFGQGSYELADGLNLTAGVRYSQDRKSRVGATVFDTLPAAMIPNNRIVLQVNDAKRSFSKTTWRVGVDYDAPALGLFYANISTGYKAGGFNDGCEDTPTADPICTLPAAALYYEPETLTAYEVGFKLRSAYNALRLNGSLFHYDYKGLQLSQLSNVCGGPCQVTTNAAAAKVDGVELEAVLRPADNHQFDLGLNWIDARYSEFAPVPGVSFNGVALNRSPKWTWTAGYTFSQELGNGGTIRANARTRFSSRYALTELSSRVFFYQPSFTKTDLSLTYSAPEDRWYVQAFAKNLENEIVLTGAGSAFGGDATFDDPRAFGVRAGFKF